MLELTTLPSWFFISLPIFMLFLLAMVGYAGIYQLQFVEVDEETV